VRCGRDAVQFNKAIHKRSPPPRSRQRALARHTSGVYVSEADATGALQAFATPASVDKPGKGRPGKGRRVFRRGSSTDVIVLLWGPVTVVEIAAMCNGVDVFMGIAEGEVIEDVVDRRAVW